MARRANNRSKQMPHFSKMVSLHRTEEDKKKQEDRMKEMFETKPDGLEYPPGCCICLTDEVLEKLGIEDMPDMGDSVHLCITGKVTGVSSDKMGRRIELQCTEMQAGDGSEKESMSSEDRAEGRYGKKDAA
jgi:hypothetical protein